MEILLAIILGPTPIIVETETLAPPLIAWVLLSLLVYALLCRYSEKSGYTKIGVAMATSWATIGLFTFIAFVA